MAHKTEKTVPAIAANGLHKSYGSKSTRFDALRGIDLEIKHGESVAITGRSGSGKSTLMHVLAGLDSPSEGEVLWDGVSLSHMGEKRLTMLRNGQIGFVFQQFFLQPTLTVLENTVLPLKIAGESPKKRNEAARQALSAVGLLDKARNRATDLSGGQKQRVAIARALVTEPSVIFADEPTGNLDSETGQQIVELLFRLHRERGITLVIVTHDLELSRRCDRIIAVQDGKVVA